MGTPIAAHLVNAGWPVLLMDLAGQDGAPGSLARRAVANLADRRPPALALPRLARHIECLELDRHLDRLAGCDLVIEAVAEDLALKQALYARIAPSLGARTVLSTNTSGLSVATLAGALPPALRARFCGTHFFNPPRYLSLVELVATPETDPAVLSDLEHFLVTGLGRNVLRTPDTPGFIANRIGVFAMLANLRHGARLGLPLEDIDALSGPLLGRPRSGTCGLADLIGLDVLARVVENLHQGLPEDPWRALFTLPGWMQALIGRGALGRKSGGGIYRKQAGRLEVLDPASGAYRAPAPSVDGQVRQLARLADPAERLRRLRACPAPQAQFLWAVQREVFHYTAVHLGALAHSARDVDLALRWGFGWRQGPLELWQAAGWEAVREALEEDIAAGQTLAPVSLPAWAGGQRQGVHGPAGSWSAAHAQTQPRPGGALYARQLWPERLHGEPAPEARVLMDTATLQLWQPPAEQAVAVLSLKTKMNTLGPSLCADLVEALERAEAEQGALVIWQRQGPFSAGADIKAMERGVLDGDPAALERYISDFQAMMMRLKYARIPVLAAVHGLALGGGCELLMHCCRVVASLEANIGLVETAIGLIPGGGGCKELALRAAEPGVPDQARVLSFLERAFVQIMEARVSAGAPEAQHMTLLQPGDSVVMHPAELLHAASAMARALAEGGYRPPPGPAVVAAAGRPGVEALERLIEARQEAGAWSGHDARVGRALARALCGGEVPAGTLVDEWRLLALEREGFLELLAQPETLARIQHTLRTGRPLRN